MPGVSSGGAMGQADADPAGGGGALMADGVLEVGGGVDDAAGVCEQVLAVLGQAQMAGGAVKQAEGPGMLPRVARSGG